MHFSQVFILMILAFLAGVFLGSFFHVPQTAVYSAISICLILIAIFFRRESRALNPKITFWSFIFLFLLFGIMRFNLSQSKTQILEKFAQAQAQLADVVAERHKIKVNVFGYIDSEPETRNGKRQFIFKSNFIQSEGHFIEADERILVTSGLFPEYIYGQTLRLNGILSLPGEVFKQSEKSGIGYASYLAHQGVFTLMGYPEIEMLELKLSFLEKSKIFVYRSIFKVKNIFQSSVSHSLTEPSASFINGLLTGARREMPDELLENFKNTGLTHILAISGYNVTIIAGLVISFFVLFFKRNRAFWFTFFILWGFCILTGAQASVVRATIMGLLLLFAQKEGRLYQAGNAVIYAGAIMVLITPGLLRFDVGFQLSFAATLGLVYLKPIFDRKITLARFNEWARVLRIFQIRENIIMTLSAQLMVLPLLIFYFHNLSIIALPANIIVLPFVPITMASGFIMGLAGLIHPFFGRLLGYFVWLLTTLEIKIISFLGGLKWVAIQTSLSWYFVLAVYCLVVYIIVHDYRKHRIKKI